MERLEEVLSLHFLIFEAAMFPYRDNVALPTTAMVLKGLYRSPQQRLSRP